MNLRPIALALTALLGCAAMISPTLAQVKARLGHAMPAEHPQAKAMKRFAEEVGKGTEGRVVVQVFDGGILGGDDKMLQATQGGTLEFYAGGVAPLSGKIKEVQIFDFPFLFANGQEAATVLHGPVGRQILDKMGDIGLVGLAWNEFGFRNLSNSERPIKSVDDISGLKLRVMQNPVALDAWKALGANAVTMSFSEVFTALETGALDGQENPLAHIYANRIHEVQKYITLTNHVYTPTAMVASKTWFDALPEADRKAILAAADAASLYQAEVVAENDVSVTEKLKESGIEIDTMPEAEIQKMRELTRPVVEKYSASIGPDFVKDFFTAIDEARASAK